MKRKKLKTDKRERNKAIITIIDTQDQGHDQDKKEKGDMNKEKEIVSEKEKEIETDKETDKEKEKESTAKKIEGRVTENRKSRRSKRKKKENISLWESQQMNLKTDQIEYKSLLIISSLMKKLLSSTSKMQNI